MVANGNTLIKLYRMFEKGSGCSGELTSGVRDQGVAEGTALATFSHALFDRLLNHQRQ